MRGGGVALALLFALAAEALKSKVRPLPVKLRRRLSPHSLGALLDDAGGQWLSRTPRWAELWQVGPSTKAP